MKRRIVVGAVVSALVVGGALAVDQNREEGTWGLGSGAAATGSSFDSGAEAGPESRTVDGRAGTEDAPGALLPEMVRAFTKAQAAAAAEGVQLTITSGYRTAAHQQELYEEAIGKYGSPQAARQWVLPPSESAHVRGQAIDVGPPAGAEWLQRNGVRFGLCQVYANEAWHFERLAPAIGQDCPAQLPHA